MLRRGCPTVCPSASIHGSTGKLWGLWSGQGCQCVQQVWLKRMQLTGEHGICQKEIRERGPSAATSCVGVAALGVQRKLDSISSVAAAGLHGHAEAASVPGWSCSVLQRLATTTTDASGRWAKYTRVPSRSCAEQPYLS